MKAIVRNQPYKVLWLTIPVITLLSIMGGSVIDLQMHDTYFVISPIYISMFFSIVLGVYGLVYWLLRKKSLVIWMTLFHVLVTIFTLLLVVLLGIYLQNTNVLALLSPRGGSLILLITFLLTLIISQILFLINVVIGIK